jgi:hypothetical protein
MAQLPCGSTGPYNFRRHPYRSINPIYS